MNCRNRWGICTTCTIQARRYCIKIGIENQYAMKYNAAKVGGDDHNCNLGFKNNKEWIYRNIKTHNKWKINDNKSEDDKNTTIVKYDEKKIIKRKYKNSNNLFITILKNEILNLKKETDKKVIKLKNENNILKNRIKILEDKQSHIW